MNKLVVAGILALIVLFGGVLIFIAGSKPYLTPIVKCSPSSSLISWMGWKEACENVTRTITITKHVSIVWVNGSWITRGAKTEVSYATLKSCTNIPTTYYSTLWFQECVTTTRTWNNIWLQIGGIIFLCLGLGFLLTITILLVAFRRNG